MSTDIHLSTAEEDFMSQEQAAQGSRQGAEEFYSISDAEVQREYV
jgi:hypothetical protein